LHKLPFLFPRFEKIFGGSRFLPKNPLCVRYRNRTYDIPFKRWMSKKNAEKAGHSTMKDENKH
jgi:hypothetical protein